MSNTSAFDHGPQDRSGKLAIVTGGNSGIGFAAASSFAQGKMDVILACRDVDRGNTAKARIGDRAVVEKIELSSLESIKAFADARLADGRPIDLLINNAGVMMPSRRKTTADGFELTFGTNHLGHFALTGWLLPLLIKSPGSRIVTVSSIAHQKAAIDFDDLQAERSYSPWKAYAQSKLANAMFGFELDRRLRAANLPVSSVVVHPGIATTRLFSSGPGAALGPLAGVVNLFIWVIGQSSQRGALPTEFAATSAAVPGGSYVGPDGLMQWRGKPKLLKAEPQAYDPATAARLWEVSEKLTGVKYDFAPAVTAA